MCCTHFPTSMYFCLLSSSLDFISDILPHWDLASDTKLMVSSTAFTYVYVHTCTNERSMLDHKLYFWIMYIIVDKVLEIKMPRYHKCCTFIVSVNRHCCAAVLTTIMATIGPTNANITPFSLGNQHLVEAMLDRVYTLSLTVYTHVDKAQCHACIPKLLRFDRVVVRMALVKRCPYQVVVVSSPSSYHHHRDGEN